MKAIGYTRISKPKAGQPDPYGISDQERSIRAWCEMGGHELVGVESDTASGKTKGKRPGFDRACEALPDRADVLVVGKLDRLARSSLDFARLIEQSQAEGWCIAVLDVGVDTSTAHGRMFATVLMALAEWEREQISERTKAALAEAKLQGKRVGRPSALPVEVVATIKRRKRAGWTLTRIADRLNADAVPTGRGGRQWWPSSVRSVLRTS